MNRRGKFGASFLLSVLALAACSQHQSTALGSDGLHHCKITDPSANESGASWADALHWDGRQYIGTETNMAPDKLGAVLGAITCDVSTSGLGANYQLQNGDGTIPAGSKIYAILGVPITQDVAATRLGETVRYRAG